MAASTGPPTPDAGARGTGFELTAHEVMRGIVVRDGELVLRPAGWLRAACSAEAIVVLVGAVVLARRGAGWWLLVPPLLALAAYLLRGAMVSVRASGARIVVRNRWSTRSIALEEVAQVLVDQALGERHRPELLVSATNLGRDWEVGVIRSVSGPPIWCDALVSIGETEPSAGATHATTKVEALRRWIAEHRAAG